MSNWVEEVATGVDLLLIGLLLLSHIPDELEENWEPLFGVGDQVGALGDEDGHTFKILSINYEMQGYEIEYPLTHKLEGQPVIGLASEKALFKKEAASE